MTSEQHGQPTPGATPATCPVCGHQPRPAFSATLLGRHAADFTQCPHCGLVSALDPHWLDEAYSSPMSAIDTGVLARNWRLSRQIAALLGSWFDDQARYVDLAGGDGILVRLMRDLGLDFAWDDPYTSNRFARGFEHQPGQRYAAATAIEVLEHVPDPMSFLRDCVEATQARAVLTTTTLYAGEVPPSGWWYYQFETGQHITFMTRRTLELIADDLGMRLHSRGDLHVFADPDLPALPFRLAMSRLQPLQLRLVSRGWTPLTGPDSESVKKSTHEST